MMMGWAVKLGRKKTIVWIDVIDEYTDDHGRERTDMIATLVHKTFFFVLVD